MTCVMHYQLNGGGADDKAGTSYARIPRAGRRGRHALSLRTGIFVCSSALLAKPLSSVESKVLQHTSAMRRTAVGV